MLVIVILMMVKWLLFMVFLWIVLVFSLKGRFVLSFVCLVSVIDGRSVIVMMNVCMKFFFEKVFE